MMKFMRTQIGKWVLFGLFGLIIVAFAVTGIFTDRLGGMGGPGGMEVARVGEERISLQELQNTVNSQLEMYKSLGSNLDDRLVKTLQSEALSQLIQQRLFLLEARRVGVAVSDAEVKAEIAKMPYFLDKDKQTFSQEQYKQLLAANNLTPAKFEDDMRNRLLSQRLLQFLEARMRITEEELRRSYQLAGDQRNISYIRIPREQAFSKMSVKPEEVKAFLADPAKLNLVQASFQSAGEKYNRPQEYCVRHILLQPDSKKVKPNEMIPAEVAAIKPTPANFTALAAKYSTDPATKKRGGDLGCFSASAPYDEAVKQAAMKTPLGKVSAPVKSAFGWHYLYVYTIKPALQITFDQAKDDLAIDLLKRERLTEIRDLNRAAAEELKKNWNAKKAQAQATGFFSRLDSQIPGMGRAPEILAAAFDAKAPIQSSPQVFESQGAYIVAEIKERKNADLAKLEKERDQQMQSLRQRKMGALVPAWMESVRERTKISYNTKLLERM